MQAAGIVMILRNVGKKSGRLQTPVLNTILYYGVYAKQISGWYEAGIKQEYFGGYE